MLTPSRLALARKVRGLRLTQLADAAHLPAGTVSAYERGTRQAPPPAVQQLAAALELPSAFLTAEDLEPLPAAAASFRAISKLPASSRDMALSMGRFGITFHEWIGRRFRIPIPDLPSLPRLDPAASQAAPDPAMGAELAAEMVRSRWGLGNYRIPNMVHLLEAHGVRVASLGQRCAGVDAFSLWWQGVPYVFLNPSKSAERSRFDAAHELGHLVLHTEDPPHGREAERAADRFAAAFLMPRDDVLARMPRNAAPPDILRAKGIWKVSAMALTYRLHEVGLSSPWHYRSTCVEFAKRGYRHHEPAGIPYEGSQVFPQVFTLLRKKGRSPADIARELHLNPSDLNELLFGLVITALPGQGSGGPPPHPPLQAVQ